MLGSYISAYVCVYDSQDTVGVKYTFILICYKQICCVKISNIIKDTEELQRSYLNWIHWGERKHAEGNNSK